MTHSVPEAPDGAGRRDAAANWRLHAIRLLVPGTLLYLTGPVLMMVGEVWLGVGALNACAALITVSAFCDPDAAD